MTCVGMVTTVEKKLVNFLQNNCQCFSCNFTSSFIRVIVNLRHKVRNILEVTLIVLNVKGIIF